MGNDTAFSFGENWASFIKYNFNDERVAVSKDHLLAFLEVDNLKDKYFLDIGCGSGIHSLAAARSGAEKIVGIDVDPHSVATSQKVKEISGDFDNWQISLGSILDDDFVSKLEQADIVYSWGVLHHTGDLWKAVKNAASLVKSGGLFYIALYEKTSESEYWILTKQKYNRSTIFGKRLMDIAYVYRNFFAGRSFRQIATSINYIISYKKNRGMEFWTDIRDWLGGWPYEPATSEEVSSFCVNELGLEQVKVKTGEANIEYLFKKRVI